MRKHGAGEQIPMLAKAEYRAEIQGEMYGERCADEAVAAVGPIGKPDAPSVVELEVFPAYEVAVAKAVGRVAVSQSDESLRHAIEVVLHGVVLETESKAEVGVVEPLLPSLFSCGLPSEAKVGFMHGIVRKVGEGDVLAVAESWLNIEALCRRQGAEPKKRYENQKFAHG